MKITDSDSLNTDHELLIRAAREAGAIALKFFQTGNVKRWNKRPNDPVSDADIAVDKHLQGILLGARPNYGWLSEETVDDGSRLRAPRTWIVDPIDGTRAFLEGRPEFALAAALVESGRPIAAVVYNPATNEFFEATEHQGARLNGRTIFASPQSKLDGSKLLASRRTFEKNNWLQHAPNAEFSYMNSIALRMAKVAAGQFDAAISLSEKNDWDIAAADLIVREAGGICTTCLGGALTYNRESARHSTVLAAASGVHNLMIGLLKTQSSKQKH